MRLIPYCFYKFSTGRRRGAVRHNLFNYMKTPFKKAVVRNVFLRQPLVPRNDVKRIQLEAEMRGRLANFCLPQRNEMWKHSDHDDDGDAVSVPIILSDCRNRDFHHTENSSSVVLYVSDCNLLLGTTTSTFICNAF